MNDFEIIGKKLPLVDSIYKALGESQYVDDMRINGMLHGTILRSPFPHARIINVDISRAKALPGVKAIITAQEIPKVKFGNSPESTDRYPLALVKVRHVGEAVAAVAATDKEMAEEALELIRVDYEPLSYYLDPAEATQPGAILIHEDKERNISNIFAKAYGDVESGFREADYVREDIFNTMPNNPAAIEPHIVICQWHLDGSLTIWASTQTPFRLRGRLSAASGLAEDKVRVIKMAVGGGFGGKTGVLDIHVVAMHLSRITGKPVKMVLNLEEVFLSTHQRHPTFITLRTGVKKDGLLVSQELRAVLDGGAYAGTGSTPLQVGAHQLMITYRLPNVKYEGIRVFTNKPIGGPMRGHGAPQIRFAVESQLDLIAKELSIDPVEIRLKNVTYEGYNHPAKKRISSCGLKEALHGVAAALKWPERKGKLPDGHGIGISCSNFPCGPKPFPHVGGGIIIEVNTDGGVNILSGAADIGQGTDTILSQIVAEVLGVRMEDTRIISADTAITPYDLGSFGSGVTLRVGNAAVKAANDAKNQLMEVISLQLETPPQKITFSGSNIYIQGNIERAMTFKEALRAYHYAGKPMPLVGRGFYEPECLTGDDRLYKEGPETPAYSFYCQGAEVKVDKETGEVKVLKLISAIDCGQPINPLSIEGQAEGSMAGGMGMALYEDLPCKDGRYLKASFLNYLIPTSMDIPQDMSSMLIRTRDPFGPLGAKEAGEGMLVGISPAIANAVYDATGVRMTDLPITADKIRNALVGKNH